jgi:hypothetical protein
MRDPRVENWLNAHKLKYSYREALNLDAVVVDAAAKQNIRITERIDDDLVLRYAVALENKADFPGIVVYANSSPSKHGVTYGLISGWHRTEAYRLADRKTVTAYVIEGLTDALTINMLRRTANIFEGKTVSAAEALQQAYYLVGQGYTSADAARLMSMPKQRVANFVAAQHTAARLVVIPETKDVVLTASQLEAMRKLGDAQLREVALLVRDARLNIEDERELIRQIREADEWHKVVTDWRTRLAVEIARNKGGQVRSPGSPIRRLPTILQQAQRLMRQPDSGIPSLTQAELRAMAQAIRNTISELNLLLKQIEQASHAPR